jgi:hypothetical protein
MLVRHPTPHPHGCWCVKDTQRLCTGERQDLLTIVVSLPVMLVIELGDESLSGSNVTNANDMIWDFPKTLSSSREQATDEENVTYDLVGLALIHPSTSTAHFTTCYTLSPPNSEFQLNCHCGFQGDGNKLHCKEEETAIQCDECKDWSHVACQCNGRASGLGEKDTFVCDLQ